MANPKPAPRTAYVAEFQGDIPRLAQVTVINETAQMYITDRKYTPILGLCSLMYSSRIMQKKQVFFSLTEAIDYLRQSANRATEELTLRAKKIKEREYDLMVLGLLILSDPAKAEEVIKRMDKRK